MKIHSRIKLLLITPIHKKGDRLSCENYRGITILCVAYKIIALILTKKLRTFLNNIVGSYQAGFVKGKSTLITSYQIFNLRGYPLSVTLFVFFLEKIVRVAAINRNNTIINKIITTSGLHSWYCRTTTSLEDRFLKLVSGAK